MREYIYSISWEDLEPDKHTLNLNEKDSVLTITGGGDNAFDLLLNADRVTCVDMNAAQTYLMDLKMNTIRYGSYASLWSMFGEGRLKDFDNYIDNLCLSNKSYHFWATNSNYFKKKFYHHGSMGRMVNMLNILKFNKAFTTHVIFSDVFVSLFRICIYMFCKISSVSNILLWNMCGVPMQQYKMITEHDKRDLYDYIWTHTLKPVITKTDVMHNNHFYYLLLNGHFTKQNCPEYLKSTNFELLKQKLSVNKLQNRNDNFLDVLKTNKFDKVVMMDHIDWNDKAYVNSLCEALKKSLSDDGVAIFKSASIRPWYVPIFHKHGFKLKRVGSHLTNDVYDRVNMYASIWSVVHSNSKKVKT